jgi:hypothetical protein
MAEPRQFAPYRPRDELYLWWFAEPPRPVLIGELNLVRSVRGVSLRYADSWIEHGFALSEDLPPSMLHPAKYGFSVRSRRETFVYSHPSVTKSRTVDSWKCRSGSGSSDAQ